MRKYSMCRHLCFANDPEIKRIWLEYIEEEYMNVLLKIQYLLLV